MTNLPSDFIPDGAASCLVKYDKEALDWRYTFEWRNAEGQTLETRMIDSSYLPGDTINPYIAIGEIGTLLKTWELTEDHGNTRLYVLQGGTE